MKFIYLFFLNLCFFLICILESAFKNASIMLVSTFDAVGGISKSLNFCSVIFLIFLQLTHVVVTLSHKGIARRALPASGGKDVVGE